MALVISCSVLLSVRTDCFRVTSYDFVAWHRSYETWVYDLNAYTTITLHSVISRRHSRLLYGRKKRAELVKACDTETMGERVAKIVNN